MHVVLSHISAGGRLLVCLQSYPSDSEHILPMDRSSSNRRGLTPPSRGSTTSLPSTPESNVPFVPHLPEKYDPDHPDADWGGIVQRTYKKRLFNDPAATRNVGLDVLMQRSWWICN